MATQTLLKKVLHAIPLGRKADPDLKAAIAADDLSAFQDAFLAVLSKPGKRLRKQLGHSPLLATWSIDAVALSGRERELSASLEELTSRKKKKGKTKDKRKDKSFRGFGDYNEVIANWLIEVGAAPGPWESIAIAELLLREGKSLTPENFTQTLAVIADTALRDSSGSLFDAPDASRDDDAIRQMIRQGESPWISSLLLSPLGGVQTLAKSGAESMQKMLLECTDTDGLVHGSLLHRLADWLAPITRCSVWSAAFHEPLWRGECVERLTLVTERAALLTLPAQQSSATDAPGLPGFTLRTPLELLIPLSGSSHAKRLRKFVEQCRKPAKKVTPPQKYKQQKPSDEDVDVLSGDHKSGKGKSKADAGKLKKEANRKALEKIRNPEVSWQSDSGCVAILRSSAEADADLITLEWHSSIPQVMVAAAGVPIIGGSWNWSVQLDDQIIPAPTAWKCSCWFLDPETVFVELEAEDSPVVKQMRQLLLAPFDRFAMLVDSVTSSEPDRNVQLMTSLPLVKGAAVVACDVTRELTISTGSRTMRTFPLWLEDDRVQHALGSYQEHDGQLELVGSGRGGVTLPLALDWHPKRIDVPADWNRCTVTESRRTVGAHEARGFRIRIGEHQVLVYRSLLAPAVSRAVLGLHTWDESVYGRVPPKGGLIQPLVEVEYPE
ncbi:MAG: hypothetical protein KDB01_25605 [Planctomycetaceae bacterium]|nr:hypothetical protein [Planctomycetaceae bacterium]